MVVPPCERANRSSEGVGLRSVHPVGDNSTERSEFEITLAANERLAANELERTMIRLLKRLWAFVLVLDDHDAVGAASAMAFQAFFSLVPLFALAGWFCHRLLKTNESAFAPLFRLTPNAVSALADANVMQLTSEHAAILPPLSAIGFLWLCSGGIARAMLQFEYAFRMPPRSWLKRRGVAIAFVFGALVVASLSVGLGILMARLGPVSSMLATALVPFGALWLLVGVFFRHATRRDIGALRNGFRGALVTLFCWAILSLGFSVYVRELADYSQFYGGLAAVAVMLFWLWLMSLALLVGAEVNARLEGARVPLSRRVPELRLP